MTAQPHRADRARADLAALFPVRDELARRADALRLRIARQLDPRAERLDARAQRCERLVRLLDTRIRIAAEMLADAGRSRAPNDAA